MIATLTREPQCVGPLADRLNGILAGRGIDTTAAAAEEPPTEPVTALELADARIPARYRRALADHPQITAWADQISGAGRPGPGGPGIAEGPSLLIASPTGTGKTYQAYGAVRALLSRGVRLRWEATTTADFYARLRPRAGHDAERDLQTLARCPLLLLDDLGAAKTSEWTEELTDLGDLIIGQSVPSGHLVARNAFSERVLDQRQRSAVVDEVGLPEVDRRFHRDLRDLPTRQ
ncbi:P-loop NTPase family protein [Streptomyces bobili]|uniref:ATP-binding protein n=1 Tax=Streptomyces bobili TaxID=67280 RepID=UPI0037163BF6